MARRMGGTHTGFSWTITDGGSRFMVGKGAVQDGHAWADLDGDGCIDLVAIASESCNYEDTDHELVAIHVPSGNVGWRALPGEASKKVSVIDGVVVVSTNSATRMRGLDPRNGQELWNTSLSDALEEDNFDGDDRAPAIAPLGGSIAGFMCKDDTWNMLDVRTGQVVKSGEGKLMPLGAGVPGLVAFGDDDKMELWDVLRNKSVAKMKDISTVRVVSGASAFGIVWHGAIDASGAYGVGARFYDNNTFQQVAQTILTAAPGTKAPKRVKDDDDDDDGDDDGGNISVEVGQGEYGVTGGFLLGGNRLFFGGRYNKGPWVGTVVPNGKTTAQLIPAPKPGYKFRTVGWCSPALVTVWEKEKGTAKLLVVGHDPNTLAPVWQAEDFGGRHLYNALHTNGSALLIPSNPGANHNEYDQHNNKCSIKQLDPSTGQLITEYPVEDVDCVALHGNFLTAGSTYFSGGLPVVYELTRRERVL